MGLNLGSLLGMGGGASAASYTPPAEQTAYSNAGAQYAQAQTAQPGTLAAVSRAINPSQMMSQASGRANVDAQVAGGATPAATDRGAALQRAMNKGRAVSQLQFAGGAQAKGQQFSNLGRLNQIGQSLQSGTQNSLMQVAKNQQSGAVAGQQATNIDNAAHANMIGSIAGSVLGAAVPFAKGLFSMSGLAPVTPTAQAWPTS